MWYFCRLHCYVGTTSKTKLEFEKYIYIFSVVLRDREYFSMKDAVDTRYFKSCAQSN